MNNVSLIGRLTKDVEVRYSQGATPVAVARFGIAVNKAFKKPGEPDADFINCVAFGKTAENIEKFFSKGRMIGISGRINTGSYEKDGKKVYTFDVAVENFTFCDSGNGAGTGAAATQSQQAQVDAEEDLPF